MTNSTATPISVSAARMRLHRDRRRKGLRCLTIEVRESEIGALVRRGLLGPEMQDQPGAVAVALYEFLDLTLGRA
jgi:hypothetical protein